MTTGFDLKVTVSAAEWGELRRRVQLLEALVIQQLRKGEGVREWFSAADLAALKLPDLPTAKNAITRLAREQGWKVREVPCQGGVKYVYHFSDLPRRAFAAIIDRVVKAPAPGSEVIGNTVEVTTRSKPKARCKAPISTGNAEPPWLLPLLRIIKSEGGTVAQALAELPDSLPDGVTVPSREEALEVLSRLGLVKVS